MKEQIGQTVYRIDSKGKQRQWGIEVEFLEDGTANKITTTGIVGGSLIESVVHVTSGKNIGKANETTPVQQAMLEANADYTQALRKGYVTDLSKATKDLSGSGNQKPMLAQKYDPTMKQKDSKNLAKLGITGDRGCVQPKKDGNRCNLNLSATGRVKLITRKGDSFLPIPHLENDLRALAFRMNFGHNNFHVLDGELMHPDLTFNQLNGLLKKQNKSPEQEALLKGVVFYLYDVMLPVGYEERFQFLKDALGVNAEIAYPSIKLIESVEIDLTEDVIDRYLEHWLALNEEGLMIRQYGMPYEPKRTWQLMKYKVFEDAEYEILDLEPDVKGNLGKFVCKPNEQIFDRDGKEITEFRAGTKGITHEEGREMLKNKADYIGKIGTIRYQLTSEYGVPRFGKLVGFRMDV